MADTDPAVQALCNDKLTCCLCSNCAPEDVSHLTALLPVVTKDNLESILNQTGTELVSTAEEARRARVVSVALKNAEPGFPCPVAAADRRNLAEAMDNAVRAFLADRGEGKYRMDTVWPDILSK